MASEKEAFEVTLHVTDQFKINAKYDDCREDSP